MKEEENLVDIYESLGFLLQNKTDLVIVNINLKETNFFGTFNITGYINDMNNLVEPVAEYEFTGKMDERIQRFITFTQLFCWKNKIECVTNLESNIIHE
jgi:hypothetical protein